MKKFSCCRKACARSVLVVAVFVSITEPITSFSPQPTATTRTVTTAVRVPAALINNVEKRRISSFVLKSSGSTTETSAQPLKDTVCLVTGASRGIGKGVALELGKQGATVYITGTTSEKTTDATAKSASSSAPPPLLGTIEETAREITAAGGQGIAVLCNHAVDDDVQRCMDQISREQDGRLDILVNNCFQLPNSGVEELYKPFWEQSPDMWDAIHTVGLRSHFVATAKAIPLLKTAADKTKKRESLPRPFIAMISSFGALTYTFNVPYGVGKAGVDRLVKDMAIELKASVSDDETDISIVSFWPGLVNTERTQESVRTGDWQKFVKLPLENAETPAFTGKAIVAVSLDATNMQKSGTAQIVAELAQEYDFNDDDETTATDNNNKRRRPPSIRSLKFLLPTYGMDAETRKKVPDWMIPDWKLPLWIMAGGEPPKQS